MEEQTNIHTNTSPYTGFAQEIKRVMRTYPLVVHRTFPVPTPAPFLQKRTWFSTCPVSWESGQVDHLPRLQTCLITPCCSCSMIKNRRSINIIYLYNQGI